MAQMTDAELVTAARGGEREAFSGLVERHHRAICGLAYSQLGNWSVAEDIAQETFLVAYANLVKLRVPGLFLMWLRRITRNLCHHWLRSETYRRKLVEQLGRREEEGAAVVDGPAGVLAQAEQKADIWDALQTLSSSVREAMVLYYVEGQSTAEAARALGVTENAVRRRLYQGRRKMRDHLERRMESELGRVPSEQARERILTGVMLGPAVPSIGQAVSGGGASVLAHHICHGGASSLMKAVVASAAPMRLAVGAMPWGKLVLCVVVALVGLAVSTGAFQMSQAPESLLAMPSQELAFSTRIEAVKPPTTNQDQSTARGSALGKDGRAEAKDTTVPAHIVPGRRIGLVTGVVRRENGQPGSGAQVSLARIAFGPGQPMGPVDFTQEIEADQEGRFAFTCVPVRLNLPERDAFLLRATLDGSAGWLHASAYPSHPNDETELVLKPAGSIAGAVVDRDGQPIPGARIRPAKYQGRHDGVDGAVFHRLFYCGAVTSGDDGSFTLPHLWKGEWRVFVEADGYAPRWTDFISAGGEDVDITMNAGQRVAGTVVAADTNQALAGVRVVLAHREDTFRHHVEATTNNEGRFQAAYLRPGPYWLRIEDDEWAPDGDVVRFDVLEGGEPLSFVIPARLGAVVEGQVHSEESGNGIAGMTVAAFPGAGRVGPYASWSSYYVATSDANGRYRLTGLPEGEYRFNVVKDGVSRLDFGTAPRPRLVANTVTALDFPLSRDLVLAGRVVDTEGRAVSGVQLTTSSPCRTMSLSESDGSFRLSGFETVDANVLIEASKHGFAMPPAGPFVLGEEGVHNVLLTVEPAGRIDGLVIDQDGRPVVDAGVTACCVEPATSDTQQRWTRTDSKGHFTIDGLHAGEYELRGMPPGTKSYGGRNVIARVTLEAGEHKRGVRATYPQGANLTISGSVVDQASGCGAPPMVMCDGPVMRMQQAERDNSFRLAGLEPGTYRLIAESSHREGRWSEPLSVQAGATDVRLVIPDFAGLVSRVVNARTGAAVADPQIEWTHGLVDVFTPEHYWRDVEAVLDGKHLRIPRIAAQELTLAASAPGFATELVHLTRLEPGKTLEGLDIRLRPGLALDGVILNPQGLPVKGARVVPGCFLNEGFVGRMDPAKTNRQGQFRIEDLAPGPQAVTVHHTDYAPACVEVTPGRPADIVLQNGGQIRGSVLADGVPVADTPVVLSLDGENAQHTKTERDGRFRFDRVPAGEVLVRASLGNDAEPYNVWRLAETPASVENDLVTEVDVHSRVGNASVQGTIVVPEDLPGRLRIVIRTGHDRGSEQEFSMYLPYDGFYRFDGLPPGPATLEIVKPDMRDGQLMKTRPLRLEPGEVILHDMVVE